MFISSVLLVLASVMPMRSTQDVDDARDVVYHHQDNNRYDSAHHIIDQVIQFSKQINYDYGLAKSLYIKSYLHRCKNETGESFLLNLKALKILNDNQDDRTPKTKVGLYINTGEILQEHFKYDEARKYYELGLDIANKYDFSRRAAEILYSLGQVERKKGNFDKARNLILQSLDLSREIDDEWTILNSYNLLGLISNDLQMYDEARDHYRKIIEFDFISENPSAYKGIAWLNIGESFLIERKFDLALSSLKTSLSHFEKIDSPSQIFNIQLMLTQFYYEIMELDKAKEVGLGALKNYERTSQSPDRYKIFNILANISFDQEDFQSARSYYDQFVLENEKFLSSQQDLIELSEQYKMEMLTASFFKEIEKQEQMAQMNQIIYILLAVGLFSALVVHVRKYSLKRSLERALREITEGKNLRL